MSSPTEILFTVGDATVEETTGIVDKVRGQLAQAHKFDPADKQALRIRNSVEQFQRFKAIFNMIALFVWIGAQGEAIQVEERLLLKDVPVRAAMLTDFQTLGPGSTLGEAVEHLLAGTQQDFPVVADGRAVGVLTREALMAGLAQSGRDSRVADAPLRELGAVEADTPLVPAVAQLRQESRP